MNRPPTRRINRLLVANRGEIATRIISSARELEIETYAIYVSGDASHAARAAHAIELPSASAFMSIGDLIDIVKKHEIDAVHPGYGFLSESDTFAKRMWDEAGAMVVGPGWGILDQTGDKLKARQLAERCHVPVSPALGTPTNSVEDVRKFVSHVGYPIMVKAVDGGGGRGIRLIRSEDQLASSVKRAVEESPSKQLFAEKAAIDGFRHIEVQIIGDGTGNVTHLWERECSIQRRYQKVVELAPSVVPNRKLIAKVIDDALRLAKHVQYLSLGTFEFLVNPTTEEYYFLEVNPRLQVEHTITESISMTDIVKTQLLLAQGAKLNDCGLPTTLRDPQSPPPAHSIQLRITAENVQSDWSLSIGKITSFQFPTGNGIRVDTHLISGHPAIVSADFDSLIAKLIITASSWEDCVRKARRALSDTSINGVKTNLDILRGILADQDFLIGQCDTQWLERKQTALLQTGLAISASLKNILGAATTSASTAQGLSSANTLFRKGDAWSVTLSTPGSKANSAPAPHHLELTRVLRNDFPSSLSAEILFTKPSTSASSKPESTPYTLTLSSTSASAAASTSHHRRANPSDKSHVGIPFPGKLVEVLVDEGDVVKEGDVLCVVQQMKMELEVRSPRSGRVGWVCEVEDGEDVGEGVLVCVIESGKEVRL
ncbi:carbamoyl-phosphate synthase L chain, ATP binding domain-containing protein [Paraphoma chrysanthemicola]|uniref:Carbamoyl-phosphate synthase L chain, ATP binding domain-containing protein n=1 Tax=Paraphoma chrysanthemicola TaxID=798071 RepID=A0A8K0VU92_9PLEO|nr:carbamoyl-phosphate synthase L chain, ATP binding domain-containing protein [Paraphoma chrysanthemicola]